MNYPSGSVGDTLTKMVGVWHDHIDIYSLDGEPLSEDSLSGTPGSAPFDNIVYVEFDGETYRQTNVTFRGRPLHVRSFQGRFQDGILRFGNLGPNDPQHIGVSGGPGRIIFSPNQITDAWDHYAEPDFIHLQSPSQRSRTTLLYRHGKAIRTLNALGHKICPDASQRVSFDPRGPSGPVHEPLKPSMVFQKEGQDHD